MTTRSELHRDHATWKADDEFWRDELAVWRNETKHATLAVERLRCLLQRHESMIEARACAIGFCEKACEAHEHALVEAARVATPSSRPAEEEHYVEAYDHAQQRETQESLKRKHHRLMAHIAMLTHVLDADA